MPTDGPTVVAGWRNIVTGEPDVRSKHIIIMGDSGSHVYSNTGRKCHSIVFALAEVARKYGLIADSMAGFWESIKPFCVGMESEGCALAVGIILIIRMTTGCNTYGTSTSNIWPIWHWQTVWAKWRVVCRLHHQLGKLRRPHARILLALGSSPPISLRGLTSRRSMLPR